MGRAPCCDKANVKRGPWSPEEDAKLKEYIEKHGTGGNWIALPQKVGLRRCGKSCRLRWLNYLRPNIRHGEFSDDEDRIICSLFASIGSRWSIIATQLPGRTDNDIKNYWNTKLKKKLMGLVPPNSHKSPHHQHISNPSISFIQTPSNIVPQAQGGYMGPIQYHDNQIVKGSSSVLMFGGREMEHDFGVSNNTGENMGFQSFDLYNNGGDDEKASGFYGGIPIDEYNSLEEIKQLISTNNSYNNLNFFGDENKTAEEKAVMYY